jgi:hypothetical protein
LIQVWLRQGVAASQLSIGESSEPQRLRFQAGFGVAAMADNRVAVRDAAGLAAARFDRLVTAAVAAATARAAELAALGGRCGESDRWE